MELDIVHIAIEGSLVAVDALDPILMTYSHLLAVTTNFSRGMLTLISLNVVALIA